MSTWRFDYSGRAATGEVPSVYSGSRADTGKVPHVIHQSIQLKMRCLANCNITYTEDFS
jgi:hypothetical protein